MSKPDVKQLEEKPELFEVMMKELENSAQMYQPTNYWSKYISETIRLIRDEGLKDFRRQKWGYFRSFGASDFGSTSEYQKAYLRNANLSEDKKSLILEYLELVEENRSLPILPFNLAWEEIDRLAARSTELSGQVCGALPMTQIVPDSIGNPLHDFEYRGNTYTHYYLNYYMRYAATNRFIDFNKIDNIVELGSGAGNQVEILKKFYPHLTFYLVDLAPYLYVCHQFLKALFPENHISYLDTRNETHVTAKKGSIVFLGNGRLSTIRPEGVTLFWNSASLGEMEPDVVQNYFSEAKPWANVVYLFQASHGKELGEKGKGGVIKKTTFEHYDRFLGENFELVTRSPAQVPLCVSRSSGGYDDAIWVNTQSSTGLKQKEN